MHQGKDVTGEVTGHLVAQDPVDHKEDRVFVLTAMKPMKEF